MKNKPNAIVKMKVDKTSTKKKADKETAKKVGTVKKVKVKVGKKENKVSSKKAKAIKKTKKGKTAVAETTVVSTVNSTLLKRWLKERQINQNTLANNVPCSTNTINRLIKNGHATPLVIKGVANELGITVEKLKELLKFEEQITI